MSARTGAVSVTDKHGRTVKFDPEGWAPNMGWVVVRHGVELYRGPEWACRQRVNATTKRTDELVLGDLVRLPGGLIRTVDVIKDSGYVNYRNEPIFAVMYCEGRTAEWSEGNSSIARGTWEIVP